MGQFATLFFTGTKWQPNKPRWRKAALSVEIHDSDFATVSYTPSAKGAGRFYVGLHPRDYFDDPAAGVSVDVTAEADGLAFWARNVAGTSPDKARLEAFIAKEGQQDESRFVFVEDALAGLFNELGIETPPEVRATDSA